MHEPRRAWDRESGDKAESTIKAVAGWFGGNRTLAARVGDELGRLDWCGVPFCGGCPELPSIRCRSGLASDLHRHVINLCRVIRDEHLHARLVERLEPMLLHPDELEDAQRRCRMLEDDPPNVAETPSVDWAADYFACCWMSRGGQAGKRSEFTGGSSFRYSATGGDSARRWRSAIASLPSWHRELRRWSFARLDAFDMLGRVVDVAGHGIYCDPPWIGPGDEYSHRFGEAQHRELAAILGSLQSMRVVVRYGDHPLIRRWYPADSWRWVEQRSTNQRGGDVREVLMVNGGPP